MKFEKELSQSRNVEGSSASGKKHEKQLRKFRGQVYKEPILVRMINDFIEILKEALRFLDSQLKPQ